jgi:hypothetical protein
MERRVPISCHIPMPAQLPLAYGGGWRLVEVGTFDTCEDIEDSRRLVNDVVVARDLEYRAAHLIFVLSLSPHATKGVVATLVSDQTVLVMHHGTTWELLYNSSQRSRRFGFKACFDGVCLSTYGMSFQP